MKDFRQLKVWEKAHAVTLAVYKATDKFPKHELYGLTSQIQRAAVSIPTNIAEGCGRRTRKDLIYFISISIGSLNEVKAYLDIISRLYPDISIQSEMAFFEALGKQIWSFRRSLSK